MGQAWNTALCAWFAEQRRQRLQQAGECGSSGFKTVHQARQWCRRITEVRNIVKRIDRISQTQRLVKKILRITENAGVDAGQWIGRWWRRRTLAQNDLIEKRVGSPGHFNYPQVVDEHIDDRSGGSNIGRERERLGCLKLLGLST